MSWFLRKKTDCSRTLPPASSDPPCDSAAPIPPPLSIQAPSEPITLANARSCACDSEAERAGEEKEKTALRELVEKLEREKERLTTNLAATRARLSVELAAAEGRRAHCGRVVAQLAQLRTELREEQRVRTEDVAQKDAEIGTLQAALAAARDAGARRDDARERFHFVLAYNGQTGSVSRTVLASDPDSLLYTMYCGEWEYPRDENGRAIITCHPDRMWSRSGKTPNTLALKSLPVISARQQFLRWEVWKITAKANS
ncbi:hypothetical protein KFL_007500020 [Klebsormidium nitens]|uniref:Uncharacterized protein n=1 Tax=Klebsormidium nitens TaxID=105231 RepID=A0A1Y1IM85_KLENI|nr:hypothetical protein KFL_007500020 [Klebsormidium nitens]|eukprot:GAQ91242.1 hypothetical protein KFL_007500020 [Klebsormidium nitens]